MARKERLLVPRVNFFDGQKVTEAVLDEEQIYNQNVTSGIVVDFHGSGIIKDPFFEPKILLDTRFPGLYAGDSGNPSKLDIEAGSYDGMGISVDAQPSDTVRGNRIEFKVENVDILGRNKPKLMVLGRAFDGIDSRGTLVAEFIEFDENTSKVSQHYYLEIISILFNNFSGGTGQTEVVASKDSLDLISNNNGYLLVKEAEPLMVFPATNVASQIESPNFDMNNFITSSTSRSITDEISLALGATNNINDLYIELDGIEQISFEKNAAITKSYGQKFLAKTNNLQRIDLLLSVERDDTRATGQEFDFSGDLVISIHEIASDIDCATDAVPENLIDFDPELTPILEMSFGQEDFEALGYKLNAEPQIVSFSFADTLISDPNIEPSIVPDRYYAFIVRRSGANSIGTIILEKGYDKVAGKEENGVELTTFERFAKQTSKFFEFDPTTKRYVNDSNASLWFKVHSDAVEVTDGAAYSDTGVAIVSPKTEEFVGGAEISKFEKNISLSTVGEGNSNYIYISHVNKFVEPDVHPRTNNTVFTRIVDGVEVSSVTQEGLDELLRDTYPILLGRVKDKNVREAQPITGTFDKPGLIDVDRVILLNPNSELLNANLINRIITPDTDCECNASYRIVGVECYNKKAGDLDDDNVLSSNDISEMINIVGNTINSEATERSILGGELDVLDFVKADLNEDETIDGFDIELLEDAIDGYVNFTAPEEIKYLVLRLENILSEDDNPTIFTDTAASGETIADNQITLVTTENVALAIRPGDNIEVPSGSIDAGTYDILTKSVAADGVTVTLTVSNLDGSDTTFIGDIGVNFTITSGTAVNTYHDNPNLVDIPFVASNYSISFINAPFEERFVDVCDLRRFVGINFIEEKANDPCDCEENECLPGDDCLPDLRNQTVIPGDLFIPNGKIMESPGVPYHGDFEYSTITVPMPPGTIANCSVDLYNTFIKSENNGCMTSAGYPAMKYSDGSFVGCEDSGSDTDLTKNRVKISNAIASIYVDALVSEGADGYADAEEIAANEEAISENFIDESFNTFSTWLNDAGNDVTITNISNPSGANQPAVFDLTTVNSSGDRFGRLNAPVAVQNFNDDFIVDFTAIRTVWPTATLTTGTVSSFATLVITNIDGSISTLKLGWRLVGGSTVKIFYSGVIEDAMATIISTFDYEIDAPDAIGDEVLFRFRRTNDVVTAFYIIPTKITETTADTFGQYVRIGENPSVQPGDGSVEFSFEIAQSESPNSGISYFTRLSDVMIFSEYSSASVPTSLTMQLSKDAASNETNRGTLTFPLNITSRTVIVSATLTLTAAEAVSVSDTFNVIPMDILNADNIGPIFNIPVTQNTSLIESFVPGALAIGDTIDIDVTNAITAWLAESGHLPGQVKGFVIEPNIDADSSFNISSVASLSVEYEDSTSGVIFKVGVSLDPNTGIASFNTKNILYDSLVSENRTVISFGVYLKKGGFKNSDVNLGLSELQKVGIGICVDEDTFVPEEECFFIAGTTATGTFVEGPFACALHTP